VQLARLHGTKHASMPVYFIDAHTGDRILSYDNLKTTSLSDADKRTHDMRNGTSYSAAVVADSSDAVANAAHVNAGHALAYYLAKHNRDSFDGNGTLVRNYVHYSTNYVNATWNGSVLTFGDGDNVKSAPLVVLDVVAHEFTHGVTDFSADLIYSNESGALNERGFGHHGRRGRVPRRGPHQRHLPGRRGLLAGGPGAALHEQPHAGRQEPRALQHPLHRLRRQRRRAHELGPST
jgi:hypothetical protein